MMVTLFDNFVFWWHSSASASASAKLLSGFVSPNPPPQNRNEHLLGRSVQAYAVVLKLLSLSGACWLELHQPNLSHGVAATMRFR